MVADAGAAVDRAALGRHHLDAEVVETEGVVRRVARALCMDRHLSSLHSADCRHPQLPSIGTPVEAVHRRKGSPMSSERAFSGEPVIEARNLVKRFGGLHAVDGMSLALAPGEIVGLIGPNGA